MLEKLGLAKKWLLLEGAGLSFIALLLLAPSFSGEEISPASHSLPPLSQWKCKQGKRFDEKWLINGKSEDVLFQSPVLNLSAGWLDLLVLRVHCDKEGKLQGTVKWKKKISLEHREDIFYSFSRSIGPGENEILFDLGRCWYWDGPVRGLSIAFDTPPPLSIEGIGLHRKSLSSMLQAKKQAFLSGERGILYVYLFAVLIFMLLLFFLGGIIRIFIPFKSKRLFLAGTGLLLISSLLLQVSLGFKTIQNIRSRRKAFTRKSSEKPVGIGSPLVLSGKGEPGLYDFMAFCQTLLPEEAFYGIFSSNRQFYFSTIRRINYYFYPALKFKTIARLALPSLQEVNIAYRMPVAEAAALIRDKNLPLTIVASFEADKFIVARNTFLEGEMKIDPKWERLAVRFGEERKAGMRSSQGQKEKKE